MECAWAKAKKVLPANATVDDLLALQRFCDICVKPEVCGVQDKKYNGVIIYKFRFISVDNMWSNTSTGEWGVLW